MLNTKGNLKTSMATNATTENKIASAIDHKVIQLILLHAIPMIAIIKTSFSK